MNSQEFALRQALCAAPADDLPRLVFADWLDEHGRPEQAEFIRGQIELARMIPLRFGRTNYEDFRPGDTIPHDRRRNELALRVRLLEEVYSRSFVPPTLPHDRCRFRRGMADYAEFWNSSPLALAAAFRIHPLRRIWVYGLDSRLTPLAGIPSDCQLSALDLTGNTFTADTLTRLGELLNNLRLRDLILIGCALDDTAAGVLCEHPAFRRLDRLEIGVNPMTDEARRRLAGQHGNRVWFQAYRDSDHWYVLGPNERLKVGVTSDDTQLILAVSHDHYQCGVFDHTGRAVEYFSEFQLHGGETAGRGERLARSLGYRPGAVRVKGFHWPGGRGISDYGASWTHTLNSPPNEYTTAEDVATARAWFDTWLAEGRFKISWGYNDMWFDRHGRAVG